MARVRGDLVFKCPCGALVTLTLDGELPICIHCALCGKFFKVGFSMVEVKLVKVGVEQT